jgi:hypothetical protein
VGVLSAVPALAGGYANGQGYTNIWSSAQGTSDSYGHATATGVSGATRRRQAAADFRAPSARLVA